MPEGAKARLGKGGLTGNIQYSPDGTRLTVATTIGIWFYDTETHQEVALFTGHTEAVLTITFSPDGNTLASGSSDDTVRLWDVAKADHKQTLIGHPFEVTSVAFSSDGRALASGSMDCTVLSWDLASTLPAEE